MPNIKALIEPFDADGSLPTISILLDTVPRFGESIAIMGYRFNFKVQRVTHNIDTETDEQLVQIECHTIATRKGNTLKVDSAE